MSEIGVDGVVLCDWCGSEVRGSAVVELPGGKRECKDVAWCDFQRAGKELIPRVIGVFSADGRKLK